MTKIEQLKEICYFTDAMRIVSYFPPSYKNQNEAFVINDNKKSFFLKIFEKRKLLEYEREVLAHQDFSFFRLSVPEILRNGCFADGKFYILMEFFNGKSLDSVLPYLSSDQIERLSKEIFIFLNEMREKTSHPYEGKENLLLQAITRSLSRFTPEDLDAFQFNPTFFMQILDKSLKLANPKNLSLITQDFRLRHIIIKNENMLGIVDLEYVKLNDFSLEIGHFFHDILLNGGQKGIILFKSIKKELQSILSEKDVEKKVLLYMVKQGLTHVAVKRKQGVSLEDLKSEVDLIKSYNSINTLTELEKINGV